MTKEKYYPDPPILDGEIAYGGAYDLFNGLKLDYLKMN